MTHLHRRFATIGRAQRATADGGDMVVEMAFASEEPVERWYGYEVLRCDAKAVRLNRLNDGAPLLFNHDWDALLGVHEGARCDSDRVLRGKVRITAATERGREAIALVEGGVLRKTSIGYRINKVIEQTKARDGSALQREIDGAEFERALEQHAGTRNRAALRRTLDRSGSLADRAEDDMPTYIVTDWEPHENSLVTVPADPTVGVGRSANHVPKSAAKAAAQPGDPAMEQQTQAAAHTADNQPATGEQTRSMPAQPRQGPGAVEMEQARRRGIENLCKANGIDDNIREHWVGTGLSIDAISDELLRIVESRAKSKPQSAAAIGLSDGESRRYSLMAAIRAVADKNWTNAGFELECSREIAKRLNVITDPNKFYVPFEVQGRGVNQVEGTLMTAAARRSMGGRRDLTAASAGAGGYLVATENMSFIELMRNRSVAYSMGARRLAGLQGNVTVPRQTAAATAYWLTNEGTSITESQQTFGQLALSPKTVGAYTEISRQLMLQSSPDAEAIITGDLAAVAGLAIDVGVLRGSGSSGEPTGIVNTGGIGSVTGTSIDYAKVLEFQTDIATANIRPLAGGYVTTPSVAALLMQRVKFSSTASPLWEGNLWDGTMSGYAAMSSNQMSPASMLYGDWDKVVVGEWGVLQVEVNPYANFQAGIIGVRAMVSVDVGLRYPAAFSLATSIT